MATPYLTPELGGNLPLDVAEGYTPPAWNGILLDAPDWLVQERLSMVSGRVSLQGRPHRAHISVLGLDAPEELGQGQANAEGTYSVEFSGIYNEVFVLAIQRFGQPFTANAVVNIGDIIHPYTHPWLGYVYRVTQQGTLPGIEPLWWTDPNGDGNEQLIGTAKAVAVQYMRPEAYGPDVPLLITIPA